MIDREKVIKGLEICTADIPIENGIHKDDMCQKCPYHNEKYAYCFEKNKLIQDALALLKEQEPRVMTLEEVLAMKFDDVVYVEVVPTHAVLSAIVLDVIPKLPEIGIGIVQFRQAPTWNGINNADLSYYSKTWRCWTSRPTDEQRKAVKWE